MTTVELQRGARLPLSGFRSDSGAQVSLRGRRGPLVVVAVHGADCESCQSYVRSLAEHAGELGEWGATVSVVTASDEADRLRARVKAPAQVLSDPDRLLLNHINKDTAALFVADEWGEIYFTAESGAEHELPSPDEIVEWVRFISIQCPECEQPEGEWRRI